MSETEREPWLLVYERPGRSGRVPTQGAMSVEERNVITINALVAEAKARKESRDGCA